MSRPAPPLSLRKRIAFGLTLVGVALLAALAACERRAVTTPGLAITPTATPAIEGSGEANLNVAPDGTVILSWIESADEGAHRLRFATTQGESWSDAATIAAGSGWFVNWADFPTVAVTADGTMYAHWLAKTGEDTYAYGVNVATSRDGGRTWGEAIVPHDDGTQTEHGFVSMAGWDDSRVLAIWLDGRNYAGENPTKEMTLRSALVAPDGELTSELVVDGRACDCCQTALVRTNNGALAAYRDRSDDEVRDISVARYDGAAWSTPRTINDDNWRIEGCPVNGPALHSDGARVAAAWFTAAGDVSQVLVALSDDEGATFSPPVRVDDGDPSGRTDIVLVPNGGALVVWLERVGEDAQIQVRYVRPDGTAGLSVPVAPSNPGRGSGFPHVAVSGDRVYFAWTEMGDISHVRSAVLSLAGSRLMD